MNTLINKEVLCRVRDGCKLGYKTMYNRLFQGIEKVSGTIIKHLDRESYLDHSQTI